MHRAVFLVSTLSEVPSDVCFVPITKIDAEKRLVYGVMAEDRVDKANEAFDYATSKPHVLAWSAEFERVTGGKSRGNLREMHNGKVAGKVVDLACHDATKRIEICAKVNDDQAWRHVEEGDYTGFSIGGKYIKRWNDPKVPGVTRYTARPTEVSLVDNPCMYGATFDVVKAGGAMFVKSFAGSKLAPATEDGVLKEGIMTEDILKKVVGESITEALNKARGESQAGDALVKAALEGSKTHTVLVVTDEINKAMGSDLFKGAVVALIKDAVDARFAAIDEKITKAATVEALEGLKKDLTAEVTKAVEDIKALPLPGKGVMPGGVKPAVNKSADGSGGDAIDVEKASPADLIKHAHATAGQAYQGFMGQQ